MMLERASNSLPRSSISEVASYYTIAYGKAFGADHIALPEISSCLLHVLDNVVLIKSYAFVVS